MELQKFRKYINKKTNLSLVDDIEQQYRKINNAKDEITKEASRISKEIFNYRDTLNNFNTTSYITLLAKYKNAAEDLGIKIDNKYEKALDQYQRAKSEGARFFGR